jgi:hypothetical protein
MAKSPKKKPRRRPDVTENAFRVVQEATGQAHKTPDPDAGKDPAAVALGRRGGLVGGKVRAQRLGKKKLSEAAKRAARARWGTTKPQASY